MKLSIFKLMTTGSIVCILAACSPAKVKHTDQTTIDFETTQELSSSIPVIATNLKNGTYTSEKLVGDYIKRIKTVDHAKGGIQSVLTLNPDAIEIARELDQMRANGKILGPFHGVPVLLKDNIETKDNMPTTAGALALKDNMTGRDSPLAAGLRAQGAIILGKTNLSQWANFRSEQSLSGWSALGGQTKNPHILDRNPCGSSSGSGAAIAASMGAGAVGTETNGSIICPSNANGIVGFKPTVGLVSQQYIVPISSTQDTAGPMTKTVTGAAMMLGAMDDQDIDYVAALDANSLSGTRIGVLRFAEGSNPDIIERFNQSIKDIGAKGATIVEIKDEKPDGENLGQKSYDLLKYEFKATLNEYLASTPDTVTTRTLGEVIAFNKNNADIELALFGQDILEMSEAMGPLTEDDFIQGKKDLMAAYRAGGIDRLLLEYNVDVLIAPSGPVAGRTDPINGDVWPSWAGAGSWAAIAGYPHLTVPMGHIHAMPIGLSFMGGKGKDAEILSYGFAYEQATNHRKDPGYLPTAEAQADIEEAMTRR